MVRQYTAGLMTLLIHIYACLGCSLYGTAIPPPYTGGSIGLTPYTNFRDWASAVALLFVVLSGNWAAGAGPGVVLHHLAPPLTLVSLETNDVNDGIIPGGAYAYTRGSPGQIASA